MTAGKANALADALTHGSVLICESIHIRRFGGLEDFSLELSDGINLVEGSNEAGKSTAASFLKFILYGMSKQERELHADFRTGEASGDAVFRIYTDGKIMRVRIERSVSETTRQKLTVVSLETNTPVKLDGEPGEVFFGMDEDLFSSSAYISQIGGGEVGGRKTAEAIENIMSSADESLDVKRALKKLDQKRVSLLYKNKKGGRIYELQTRRDDLTIRLKDAIRKNEEIFALDITCRRNRENLETNTEKLTAANTRLSSLRAKLLIPEFDHADSERQRLVKLAKRVETIAAELKKDGFTPDDTYLSSLREAGHTRTSAAAFLDGTRRLIDECDRSIVPVSDGENSVYRFVESSGGTEALIARQEKVRKNAKKAKAGALSALIAAVFLVAAVVICAVMSSVNLAFVFGAAAAVSAVVFALTFSRRKKAEDKAAALLRSLGVSSDAEIASKIKSIESKLRANAETVSRRHDLESRLSEAEDALRAAEDNLDSMLLRWDALGRDSTEVASEIDSLLRSHESVRRELEMTSESLRLLETRLSVYDLDELKAQAQLCGEIEGTLSDAIKKAEFEVDYYKKTRAILEEKLRSDDVALAEKSASLPAPAPIRDELSQVERELKKAESEYEVCELAMNSLGDAETDLRSEFTPALSAKSGQILSVLTDGRYSTVGIDSDFSMLYDAGRDVSDTRDIAYMSSGTRDAAYLAMRLSMLSMICKKALPPMIFDESFSRIDDGRFANVLSALRDFSSSCRDGGESSDNGDTDAPGTSARPQIIMLTSQKREEAMMVSEGIEHNYIRLDGGSKSEN